jgi:hypothetical protein
VLLTRPTGSAWLNLLRRLSDNDSVEVLVASIANSPWTGRAQLEWRLSQLRKTLDTQSVLCASEVKVKRYGSGSDNTE